MVAGFLSPLYLVTDRHQTNDRSLMSVLKEALAAGTRMVQLRERDLETRAFLQLAYDVVMLTRQHGASLFINERVDLASAVGADGVHLRSDSLPVRETRRIVGSGRLIGISAHSVDEVMRAEQDGADFVVLGPIYDTASKRPYGPPIGLGPLEESTRRCRIPIYGIGGIDASRVQAVKRAGAFGVAVVSSIIGATCVESATRQVLSELTDFSQG